LNILGAPTPRVRSHFREACQKPDREEDMSRGFAGILTTQPGNGMITGMEID
jgi:hypothetical protein